MLFADIRRSPNSCGRACKASSSNILSATLYQHGGGGNFPITLPPISFFDFRRLINAGELDGVIIVEKKQSHFTRDVVRVCKFFGIPKVGIIDFTYFNPETPVHWLAPEKAYLMQLETQVTDGCNLNCKGCCHFSNLFKANEIYPLENFRRDVRQLSQVCDVTTFFLLGGEPLIMKNFDEYMDIARQYFPTSFLGILTNGLQIPSLPQKILRSMSENNFIVHISVYPQTVKIAEQIKSVLYSNNISYKFRKSDADKKFRAFMTLHAGNDPNKARKVCGNNNCRFLRDGRIYKCPIDALSYRFAERFGLKNYPKATSVDIYSPNFASLLEMLDGNVEMCGWCAEEIREFPWEPSKKPKLEDWLANPDEVKALR